MNANKNVIEKRSSSTSTSFTRRTLTGVFVATMMFFWARDNILLLLRLLPLCDDKTCLALLFRERKKGCF